jgi:hypothetical protein
MRLVHENTPDLGAHRPCPASGRESAVAPRVATRGGSRAPWRAGDGGEGGGVSAVSLAGTNSKFLGSWRCGGGDARDVISSAALPKEVYDIIV